MRSIPYGAELLISITAVVSLGCPARFDPLAGSASDSAAGTTTSSTSTSTSEHGVTSSADHSTDGASTSESSTGEFTGESSTGASSVNFALDFDGGLAISAPTSVVTFDGDPYTIEMWIMLDGAMEGVLFDTTVTDLGDGNGITLVRDPSWIGSESMVFYDFGVMPPLWVAGADPATLSPAWHHLAFTHSGSDLTMWLDGDMVVSKSADVTATNPIAPIAIGTQPTTPFVPLHGVIVDELKLSNSVRYVAPFVPDVLLGDVDAVLYWSLDEGEGDVAVDKIQGLEMALSGGVTWHNRD